MFYVMHKLPYLSGIPNILSHTETPSIFANSVPSSFQLDYLCKKMLWCTAVWCSPDTSFHFPFFHVDLNSENDLLHYWIHATVQLPAVQPKTKLLEVVPWHVSSYSVKGNAVFSFGPGRLFSHCARLLHIECVTLTSSQIFTLYWKTVPNRHLSQILFLSCPLNWPQLPYVWHSL